MTDTEWGVFFDLLETLVYGDGRPWKDKAIGVARKAEELRVGSILLEFISWKEEIVEAMTRGGR